MAFNEQQVLCEHCEEPDCHMRYDVEGVPLCEGCWYRLFSVTGWEEDFDDA